MAGRSADASHTDLPATIRSLLRPEAFDHPSDDLRLIQTHISWILLSGEFAYKIKKPVRFRFLDYRDLAQREDMCRQEVLLNRRTCPDAYLGAIPVVERDGQSYFHGRGRTIEYAVKMRRLSREGWLSTRLEQGDVSAGLMHCIAESVHAFHASIAGDESIARYGSADAVGALWGENLDEISTFIDDTISKEALRSIATFGSRFLADHRSLIGQRAAEGRVRDAHGDLRSDSIHIAPNGDICLTDCIEFSERMRCGDVAADVAFLAMDLDFRAREDLADEFCGSYIERSADDEALTCLLPFYRCYRGAVRGKVESITARETEIDADQAMEAHRSAQRYFALAQRYAEDELPQALIILGGLSGSGKSHLGAALASRLGAVLVRSDAVRRQLQSGSGAPGYSRDARAHIYEVARQRVRVHLEHGRSVVFDATHIEAAEREAARDLAQRIGVPALLAWVAAAEDVIQGRLVAREQSANAISDARWETYLEQRKRAEAPTGLELGNGIEVDGAQSATANIAAIVARMRAAV